MLHVIGVDAKGFEVDLLDLGRLASEYGRIIYPCKAWSAPTEETRMQL